MSRSFLELSLAFISGAVTVASYENANADCTRDLGIHSFCDE